MVSSLFQNATAVDNYNKALFRTILSPQCLDVSDFLKQFEAPPPGQTKFVIRHIGEPGSEELSNQIANPVTWPVGNLTGLLINPYFADFKQRGYKNDNLPIGSSAFQVDCKKVGFLINTFQFNHSSGQVECPPGFPNCSGGPQAVLRHNFIDPQPVFIDASSEFTIQAHVKLPWVHFNSNPAVAQLSFFARFEDGNQSKVLWLAQIFDSRPWGQGVG